MKSNLLRELSDWFRFMFRIPANRKALVFYAEHEGYHAYFSGLLDELTGRHKQPVCYITSDPTDPILKTAAPLITPLYINTLLPYFMAMINCRVLAMTMPDLQQMHIKRTFNDVHYLYIFHALVSTHMMYLNGAFDYYDSIHCAGKHHIDEIRKREQQLNLKPKELVEVGYHRIEVVHRSYQEYLEQPHPPKERPVILIAPSWTEHNILIECGEALIDTLLAGHCDLIVRPHPEMKKHRPDVLDALQAKFGNEPRVVIESSVKQVDAFWKADVLITDWSGVAFEFAFGTDRPVLSVDLPRKVRNPDFGSLGIEPMEVTLRDRIGRRIAPQEIGKAAATVHQLIQEKSRYATDIRELRTQYCANFGHSSEVGAQHIMGLLKRAKPDS